MNWWLVGGGVLVGSYILYKITDGDGDGGGDDDPPGPGGGGGIL